MKIKLSEYNDKIFESQECELNRKCDIVLNYLSEHIDDMGSDFDNSSDKYSYLSGWLLNFYKDDLYESFKLIDYDISSFEKNFLYSFIMSITRGRSNYDVLMGVLIDNHIINGVYTYPDGMYEIETDNYGDIQFYKLESLFDEKDVLDYFDKLGDYIVDSCHEVSYFLLKRFKQFKAVTAYVEKNLGCTMLHSFILDCEYDYVIDATCNLYMPKDLYYKLCNVVEINVVSYDECVKESKESRKYDESGTLFDLLRNALYKEYIKKSKRK